DSGREDYIDEALFYKESASKFIIKFQQNLSIQYIISSILALIKKDFMHFITPLINNNASIYEVNNAIDIHIIKPIEDILSNTDLSLHFNQVTNLLYFLAGNCHICWDKKC
ncbi:ABC-three component system protein, partial [Acinetobacter sp. 272263]